MLERSHKPSLSAQLSELETLQQRADTQRSRHRKVTGSFDHVRHVLTPALLNPIQHIRRLPKRYLIHTVVALAIPAAIGLSQLAVQPTVEQQAPVSVLADTTAKLGPIGTDTETYDLSQVGDLPLAPSDAMPMPISLTSRSEALAPVAVQATIAQDIAARLRNGPGVAYDAVGELDASTSIDVIGRYGEWLQVRESNGQQTYWVPADVVNMPQAALNTLFEVDAADILDAPPALLGQVSSAGLSLQDGPGTNYVGMMTLDQGLELELIEQYKDWLRVSTGEVDGWVKAELLDIGPNIMHRVPTATTLPDANPDLVGVVQAGDINMRGGPGVVYDQVGNLAAGTVVDLLAQHGEWFKVALNDGSDAWVFSDLLNIEPMVLRRVPVTNDIPAVPEPEPLPAPAVPATNPNPMIAAQPDAPAVASAPSGLTAMDSSVTASIPSNGGNMNAYAAMIPASGDVAGFALRFVGSAYVYGGASPGAFDCSGLTMYVYANYGVSLPHNAAAQFSGGYGALIEGMHNLAPGDLVFFAGTNGPGIGHVGLYVGGGRFVHAMMPGLGVQVSNLWESYWVNHYYGAIRVYR
ncbi:MAG: SH3 domain-containing protein [Chloroflexaceae bacterium]|nr:SH3 domain-containing protein [Chloroflexaceae bacterium]